MKGGHRPGSGRKPGFHHSERTRERIRTAVLVKRLQAFVLGTIDRATRKPVVMSASQVAAALGLLRKTLPDLQTIEHLGEIEVWHHVVSADPLTEEEWQKRYAGSGQN